MIISRTLRAKWVLPIDQPPIENGFVTTLRQTPHHPSIIANLGRWTEYSASLNRDEAIIDLGDVALIPALVNAHTHLEFSHLRQPLGKPGIEFTDWIRLVVAERNRLLSTASDEERVADNKHKSSAILRGMAESYRDGVGCIGEIATSRVLLADYQCPRQQGGLDLVVFHELLGRKPERIAAGIHELQQFLAGDSGDLRVQRGISPHAPYSVHHELLAELIQIAIRQQSSVAMHLAETEAERDLICNQSGAFVELLKDFGIWEPNQFKPNQTMIEILEKLSASPRALIIHGNYLNDSEIDYAARYRDRLHLVYCPRTHDFFGHRPYPLQRFRESGLLVAVGTDSRASNPDLSLFAELKLIRRNFPQLSDLEILQMGTLDGARALGRAERLGSLKPGKIARLSVIANPQPTTTHDWQWLFAEKTDCSPVEC